MLLAALFVPLLVKSVFDIIDHDDILMRNASNIAVEHVHISLDSDWNFDYNKTNNGNQLPQKIWQLYDSMLNESLNINITSISNLFVTQENALKFDLGTLQADRLIDAELFVYRMMHHNNKHSNYIIRLHKVLPSDDLNVNADFHKLLNVAYVSSSSGWQVFKVKEAVLDWLTGDPNLGFLLTASNPRGKPVNITFLQTTSGQFRPLLVLYFTSEHKHEYQAIADVDMNDGHDCKKMSQYVDFGTLGWNNFIIAPDGFHANECSGLCPFQQLTNNAKLLSMSKKKHDFCCIPLNYHSFPIMFYDRFENVIIRKYPQMVVATCGCH